MPEIIEPFRIKVVEPIKKTTVEERTEILKKAFYNPFLIDAEDVLIDLLTDSGTSAMSARQWAGIMVGDESYAGSSSFKNFRNAVQDIFGFEHVIPTHQGRAAEKILMSIVAKPGLAIPSNNHFDTTRANIEFTGCEAVDVVCDEAADIDSDYPFKGNINLEKLEALLKEKRSPIGMITITNNTGGGQPVSLANIRAVSELLKRYGVPFFIDACRFAENAYFIKQREPGYADKTPLEIAREIFALADGVTISLKKDGFGNIGGFLAVRDEKLAEQARNLLILTEGFPTYGGLAGRDLDALAIGLYEALEESYLEYRLATIRYLSDRITSKGARVVQPAGGHAVYVDAAHFYPHIPASEFPAQVLVNELYRLGGIRAVEIGSVMFGKCVNGVEQPASKELVRLAMPRRVYTQAHVNYIGEVFEELFAQRDSTKGLEFTYQAPFLRHFTAKFKIKGQ